MRSVADEHWQKFGAELRSLRQAKGIGLRQFAREIPLSSGYQCNLEYGVVAPPSVPALSYGGGVRDPSQSLVGEGREVTTSDDACLLGTSSHSTNFVHNSRHEPGGCPDVLPAGRRGAANVTDLERMTPLVCYRTRRLHPAGRGAFQILRNIRAVMGSSRSANIGAVPAVPVACRESQDHVSVQSHWHGDDSRASSAQ